MRVTMSNSAAPSVTGRRRCRAVSTTHPVALAYGAGGHREDDRTGHGLVLLRGNR